MKITNRLRCFGNAFIYKLIILSSILMLFGCQSVMMRVVGVKYKQEYVVGNQKRLQHYEPFLKVDNISIYTFKNPNEFCKYFSFFGGQISTLYFEDIDNNIYYKVDCFDDLKDTLEDLNNGDISYLKSVSEEEFLAIKTYITQSSERMYHQENNDQTKKWNIYLSTGTFIGGLVKKRTLSVEKLKELNHLYILDLSVDNTNKTITKQDFETEDCKKVFGESAEFFK